MSIKVKQTGDFSVTVNSLKKKLSNNYMSVLDRYGELGVQQLSLATPVDSGKTAESWFYTIEEKPHGFVITWSNSNVNDGVNIAIILQYGHGTGTGGYVVGRDYIKPAIRPVFDGIVESIWKEVNSK